MSVHVFSELKKESPNSTTELGD